MSKEKNSQNKIILDRLILALDKAGLPKHGRGVLLTKCTGYSSGQLSAILNNKVALNERFIKSVCREYLINEKWLETGEGDMFTEGYKAAGKGSDTPSQQQTVSERLAVYSPEVAWVADWIELKVAGKTPAERFKQIEEMMDELRKSFK